MSPRVGKQASRRVRRPVHAARWSHGLAATAASENASCGREPGCPHRGPRGAASAHENRAAARTGATVPPEEGWGVPGRVRVCLRVCVRVSVCVLKSRPASAPHASLSDSHRHTTLGGGLTRAGSRFSARGRGRRESPAAAAGSGTGAEGGAAHRKRPGVPGGAFPGSGGAPGAACVTLWRARQSTGRVFQTQGRLRVRNEAATERTATTAKTPTATETP